MIDTPVFGYTLREAADPAPAAEADFSTKQADDVSLRSGPTSWFPTDQLWELLAAPELVRSALRATAVQSRVLTAIRDAHHAGAIALPEELLIAIDGALAGGPGARPTAVA